jgi:hypothetical protein
LPPRPTPLPNPRRFEADSGFQARFPHRPVTD